MAAGDPETKTTLDALYKIVYPKGYENVIPEQAILQGKIDFDTYLGEKFMQPIQLTLPGGVTYGGENTGAASGAYDLKDTVPATTVKTEIVGSQLTIRETIGYGAAKSARGGPESFKGAVGHVFEGMTMVGRRRIEMDIIHGRSATALGEIASVSTNDLTITAATWAPGCFIGSKSHVLSFLDASGTPTWDEISNTVTLSSVNYATRVLSVSSGTGLAAGDMVQWTGQRDATVYNTCLGIVPAIDTLGTVWNKDNTGYEMHKGEEFAVGATDLSFDAISDLLGQMYTKGASGEFDLFCSPVTWTNLISPEVAVRRHDASYKPERVKVGHEAIEFRHLIGTLKVIAHPMCKEGEAFVIAPKLWQRVGSTDLTFEQDVGANVKKIFLHIAAKNGFEVRCYSDQAPFTRRLGWTGLLTGIVNS